MSRSISSDIITRLESNEIMLSYLLEYTIDSITYRYNNVEVPVNASINGSPQLFEPRTFSFDSINYSYNNIIDSVNVKVDNIDSLLTTIFVDKVVSESTAVIYLIIFNDDNSVLETQQLFNGFINEFKIDESELNMTVTSIFAKWDQSSNIKHSSFCRWKQFKGEECKYSGGETVCDRSYARCVELGNIDNYGGFRWIPSIEDKEIWWGPRPEQLRR